MAEPAVWQAGCVVKLHDTTLSEAVQVRVDELLGAIAEESRCRLLLLLGSDGYTYARAGDHSSSDSVGLATLTAAAFAAAAETSRAAGEDAMQSMYCKGSSHGLYVLKLNSEYLLAVRFDGSTTFGLVKFVLEQASGALCDILAQHVAERDADPDPQKGRWRDIVRELRESGKFEE